MPLGINHLEAIEILQQVPNVYKENGMWHVKSAKSAHIAEMIRHQKKS